MSSKKSIYKRKLKDECWNIDLAFLKWLEEHLTQYLKDAGKIVDLTYHKYTYEGTEYTLEEIINMMLTELHIIKYQDWWDDGYRDRVDKVLDLFKLSFHSLWW